MLGAQIAIAAGAAELQYQRRRAGGVILRAVGRTFREIAEASLAQHAAVAHAHVAGQRKAELLEAVTVADHLEASARFRDREHEVLGREVVADEQVTLRQRAGRMIVGVELETFGIDDGHAGLR